MKCGIFGAFTRTLWRSPSLRRNLDDHGRNGSIKALQYVAIETENSPPFRCVFAFQTDSCLFVYCASDEFWARLRRTADIWSFYLLLWRRLAALSGCLTLCSQQKALFWKLIYVTHRWTLLWWSVRNVLSHIFFWVAMIYSLQILKQMYMENPPGIFRHPCHYNKSEFLWMAWFCVWWI